MNEHEKGPVGIVLQPTDGGIINQVIRSLLVDIEMVGHTKGHCLEHNRGAVVVIEMEPLSKTVVAVQPRIAAERRAIVAVVVEDFGQSAMTVIQGPVDMSGSMAGGVQGGED